MGRTLETILGGLAFPEGPRWRDGRLWFSDMHAHEVIAMTPEGKRETVFAHTGPVSGLGWLPDGRMLVVSMIDQKLLRIEPDGRAAVHGDLSSVATGRCNDMVVDAAGRAYVGNFGYDYPDGEIKPAKLARVDPDGTVSVAADELVFPNGAMITPDGKTLILGETLGAVLTAFDIAGDGSLSNRRVWASTAPRVPDGIALDAAGAIWIANPIAPECVRIAEGGEVLEVIDTGQPCYACMLGGEDGRTLFMLTAKSSIAHEAAAAPSGKLLIATVEHPRAGWP